jgi:hypothetical protein
VNIYRVRQLRGSRSIKRLYSGTETEMRLLLGQLGPVTDGIVLLREKPYEALIVHEYLQEQGGPTFDDRWARATWDKPTEYPKPKEPLREFPTGEEEQLSFLEED